MAKKKLPNLSLIENKINVNLYGGKSYFKGVRDTKYRGEVISCDCKSCSYRERGCCLKVTSIASKDCKFGKKHIYEGYTPQAAVCSEWCHVFKSEPTYNKLKSVSKNIPFGIIEDCYVINTGFVGVSWNENGTYSFKASIGLDTMVYIKKEKASADFFEDLLTYKPYTLMGGLITQFPEDVVPLILKQMKELAPDLYNSLIETFPHFLEVNASLVGKEVYLNSLKPDIDIHTNHGWFHLSADRKTLICNDYRSALLPFNAGIAKIEIEVTDEMTYTVQCCNEVCSDTRLVEGC